MGIVSPAYIFFLIIFSLIFYYSNSKIKLFVLLFSSLIFYYLQSGELIVLFVIIVVINYYFSAKIIINQENSQRKKYLIIGLVFNIAVLLFYKYFNAIGDLFYTSSANNGINRFKIEQLPGISFFTFVQIGYLVDLYRKGNESGTKLTEYASFITFFPSVLSGPIERSTTLLPQLKNNRGFNYELYVDGLKLIAWGIFKKTVIADRLAIYVNNVYSNPHGSKSLALIIATFFFSIQIYCDFSGYSHIAIGSAQLFGIKLTQNFRQPYLSKSIKDFWNRWHITLSNWIRDYIFLSLAYFFVRFANKVKITFVKKDYFSYISAVILSMALVGIWHGSKLTFLVWGVLHGIYLSVSLIGKKKRKKITKAFRLNKFPKLLTLLNVITTFILVCFSWIFFKSNNLYDAVYVIRNLFSDIRLNKSYLMENLAGHGLTLQDIIISFVMIIFLFLIQYFQQKEHILSYIKYINKYFRWSLYLALTLAIIFLGLFNNSEFIYYQF